MTLGANPYPSVPVERLFQLLREGHRMECPQECPPEVYRIMRDCWDENPMRRPNFTKLIQDIDKTMLCCQVGSFWFFCLLTFEHGLLRIHALACTLYLLTREGCHHKSVQFPLFYGKTSIFSLNFQACYTASYSLCLRDFYEHF